MPSILETLEEQCSFKFTGRINILKVSDNQFLGVILIKEGVIVASSFLKKMRESALYSLIIYDLDKIKNFKLVIEPEIVLLSDLEYHLEINDFKKKMGKIYNEQLQSNNYKPNDDIKLEINTKIFNNDITLDVIEFRLLKSLLNFTTVEDIYENSESLDFEVTRGLVSLRKKNAIRVIR